MFATVKFSVYGGLYNDYLNKILESEFVIKNIEYNHFGFTAECYAADYRKIAYLSQKYQCRIRIVKKTGIYFILRKVIKRKGLVYGSVAFMVLSYVFSCMVWTVNIDVQDTEIKNRIAAQLFSSNVYPGVFYDKEYFEEVSKSIVQHDKDIGYINLNFYKGTLQCNVSLRKYSEDYLQLLQSQDIYAALGGVIEDIRVYSGFAKVKAGQSVAAGDILVSAADTDKFGNTAQSAVRAYIEGLCTKEYSVFIPYEKDVSVYTGNIDTKKTLYFMGNEYSIKKSDVSENVNYSSKSTLEYGEFFGFKFPFTIKTEYFYERDIVHISHDLLKAQHTARMQLQHITENDVKLKKEINREYSYRVSDDGVTAVCTVYGRYDMTS